VGKVNDIKEIIANATANFLGSDLVIEIQPFVANGKKFKYIVNGFSRNWTCIQVQWQEDGEKWKHKTIRK
jgi:hypothetical protein